MNSSVYVLFDALLVELLENTEANRNVSIKNKQEIIFLKRKNEALSNYVPAVKYENIDTIQLTWKNPHTEYIHFFSYEESLKHYLQFRNITKFLFCSESGRWMNFTT